jgi:hypothetical protein
MKAPVIGGARMSLFLDDAAIGILVDWTLSDVRAPLCDINETFLRLLVDIAKLPEEPASDFIADLRAELCGLAEPIRSIAVRTPVLLVDMDLRDRAVWKVLSTDSTSTRSMPTCTMRFPRQRALKLARSALMLIWHLARTDRDSSLVLMGLSAPVIEIVRTLRPQQVDRIAERQVARLRPRWEDRPAVWRQLLANAADNGEVARGFTLRALQLISASDRMP